MHMCMSTYDLNLCLFVCFSQMSRLSSALVLFAETVPQDCTMALFPARAARASSSAASATSVSTAAAVTRTARCHANSATAASTAGCSSACRWEWTAKVSQYSHICRLAYTTNSSLKWFCMFFACWSGFASWFKLDYQMVGNKVDLVGLSWLSKIQLKLVWPVFFFFHNRD